MDVPQFVFHFCVPYRFLLSDDMDVVLFGIVLQIPEALTSFENIAIHPSVSFIQQAVFEHYSPIDSHAAISSFFSNKNVAVNIIVQVSLGTCARLSLWFACD